MSKQKGFLQIIAILGILVLGAAAFYGYSQVSKDVQKLGGSVVANKYGGTGQNSSAWSGLLKVTAGTWATTSLTDDDIPDDITVTGITTLTLTGPLIVTGTTTLASTTINNTLSVTGTSSFTGAVNFGANIPTIATSTATTPTNVASVYFVTNQGFATPTWSFATSTVLRNSNDAEASTTASTTMVKLREITLNEAFSGEIEIKFDLKQGSGSNSAYGQIYRNGVAVGTQRVTTSGSYATYTEDLSVNWSAGDLIQLYGGIGQDGYSNVRNFRFYYDGAITYIDGKLLLPAIHASSTISTTNSL